MNATRSVIGVQRTLAQLAISFNDVGERDFPGSVRFVQPRPRRYVVPTPVAAVEAVLRRQIAILENRFGRANAGRHQQQNCYRSKAKKRAHRFDPINDRESPENCWRHGPANSDPLPPSGRRRGIARRRQYRAEQNFAGNS
jgi:hypothetical protein